MAHECDLKRGPLHYAVSIAGTSLRIAASMGVDEAEITGWSIVQPDRVQPASNPR